MSSAGLRLGGLPLLKAGDLIHIERYRIYQPTVYANSKSRHYSFCTPKCASAINNYLDYRKSCGENVTPKSLLLRREFDRNDIFSVASDTRPLSRYAIKKSLSKVLYASD